MNDFRVKSHVTANKRILNVLRNCIMRKCNIPPKYQQFKQFNIITCDFTTRNGFYDILVREECIDFDVILVSF